MDSMRIAEDRYRERRQRQQRKEERHHHHSVSCSIHHRPNKGIPHYSYKPPQLPPDYDAEVTAATGYLELARFIPQDGRIQLPFDFHWQIHQDQHELDNEILKANPGWLDVQIEHGDNLEVLRDKARSKVQSLNAFLEEEFLWLGKMIVWDINPSKPAESLEYDIGDHLPSFAISRFSGVERNWEETRFQLDCHPHNSSKLHAEIHSCIEEFAQQCCKMPSLGSAPWQRIILCQGLPFASQDIGEDRHFPFLVYDRDRDDDPIRRATNLHLSSGRIGGSKNTNPYSDPHSPFHITFFEKLSEEFMWLTVGASRKKNLKIGYLYGKPQNGANNNQYEGNLRAFRKSSFTMVAASSPNQENSGLGIPLEGDHFWTILVLSPSHFFPSSYREVFGINEQTEVSMIRQQTAQLSLIVYALNEIEKRWIKLNEYIASLLVEDFMEPETYTKLLFDDEIFSRSRLYFWIIGCLNEFDVSIEDNIKQSRLFRQGQVEPLLKLAPPDPETPEPQDLQRLRYFAKRAEELEQGLEDIQVQFRAKIETVQSLREGLFNASALMESRSSTKLGQNVQLLTYASIFYLPLGFCAALWAIPDITENATKIPFVLTACVVGFVTYVIVFNLGNIAGIWGKMYVDYRAQILRHMENDENESWQDLRRQFGEFPPSHERQIPSEWWILRYQTHKLFSRRNHRRAAESGDA